LGRCVGVFLGAGGAGRPTGGWGAADGAASAPTGPHYAATAARFRAGLRAYPSAES
jgi:hypothetical protein